MAHLIRAWLTLGLGFGFLEGFTGERGLGLAMLITPLLTIALEFWFQFEWQSRYAKNVYCIYHLKFNDVTWRSQVLFKKPGYIKVFRCFVCATNVSRKP